MAEWEHKERNWSKQSMQMADGQRYSVQELKRAGVSNPGNFASWLNMQCKDGWEVIKIARDFSAGPNKNEFGESIHNHSTWCVFRRKAE